MTTPPLSIGERPLTLADLDRAARRQVRVTLAPAARDRMAKSAATLAALHDRGEKTYGVTTSVGASVRTAVPPPLSAALSHNLFRMHGVGTGRPLTPEQTIAVLCVRLSTFAAGRSGVRPLIADRIVELLDRDLLPVIPAEGSVGASGDLTPMSYLAAVIAGERELWRDGRIEPAAPALHAAGLAPLSFAPKEALALMNGTSVSTALAALAHTAAARLARLAARATALAIHAIGGNPEHVDPAIHLARPHPGQIRVAAWIRHALGDARPRPGHLQDPYSLRCAPHIIGVLVDALDWTGTWLETELNGVSDNPIIDVDRGVALHGGNFYGGHVAFACDALKTALAQTGALLDRQLQLICNPAENHGLPANLVGVEGPEACVHNGFKAATIATSALAAEALKLTMPAGAFTRSTEQHNQDMVPMATLAARDLERVVELTEQITAIALLAACQAVDLRADRRDAPPLAPAAAALRDTLRAAVPRLTTDRRMDHDITAVLTLIRRGALDPHLAEPEEPQDRPTERRSEHGDPNGGEQR